MLKFGFRHNNFYPIMLLIFIFLRKCMDILLKLHPYKNNIDFIIPFLIFSSQSLIGYLIHLYYYKKNILEKKNNKPPAKIGSITLITNKTYANRDNKIKRWSLMIFASFFNFIGAIIRSDDVINFGTKEENNSLLEIRVRSIQIIISSLLCYYALKFNIYKHQKLSLYIISFFLLVIIIVEFYISINIPYKIFALFFSSMSCLFRSFLDVSEKYLFDYNYVNILKMMIYEGLIGLFLYLIYFLSSKSYQNHGKYFINDIKGFDWDLISFLLLIILYLIISGFRNAYRVTTNKYYSPMSRALFESTFDPLLFLYNTLTFNRKDEYKGFWIYFSIVLFCLTIIAFFSLVYNDFIILYCCGLQHNTYSEITSRLYSQNDLFYDDNSTSLSAEDEKEIKNIELKKES